MSSRSPVGPLVVDRPSISVAERGQLQARARRLAWAGNAWHVAEFLIALWAGAAAGSIALVGFGVDSLIELAAGTVIVWLFTGSRTHSEIAERRAQQLIAGSFFLLAGYIAVVASRDLINSSHPAPSWIGIVLAAVTAIAMPLLGRAKRGVGVRLTSAATVAESSQTMLCAYLSVALLLGLAANALLGWWWADPLSALVIAGIAAREGVQGWNGDSSSDGCC